MKRCSIIIQGEGKGHFSQALTAIELLEKSKVEVRRVYLGKSFLRKTPAYFHSSLDVPVKVFYSPNFLRTPDRKGIRIIASILLNLIISPIYIFEATRIGWLMIGDKSSLVLNFYDPVGGLACKYWKKRANRIVLSHHFYLSHPDFIHPHGFGNSYFWLMRMNKFMVNTADKVMALSFRTGQGTGKIEVIPPLIRGKITDSEYQPAERDLCYFLNPGFDAEILEFYRQRPDLKADIFTDTIPKRKIPGNIVIHPTSRVKFQEAMLNCKRIITTAGFDTVAEAFYLGIPIFMIPAAYHYEQYCNALDASRTGMAFQMEEISDLEDAEYEPASNKKYREWVDSKGSYW